MTELNGRPLSEIGSELEHSDSEVCMQFYAVHGTRGGAVGELAQFARWTGRAKLARLAGDIVRATRDEREAENAYNRLPRVDRW